MNKPSIIGLYKSSFPMNKAPCNLEFRTTHKKDFIHEKALVTTTELSLWESGKVMYDHSPSIQSKHTSPFPFANL